MIVGGALTAGGYALARVYSPPEPPGEVAGPAVDAPRNEDFKKLAERVDKLGADLDAARKQIAGRPDSRPDPELKAQRDRIDGLDQTLSAIPARFDSLDQKIATIGQVESANSPTRVDAIDKRVNELAQTIETIRRDPPGTRRSQAPASETGAADNQAMNEAIALYQAKKYAEAKNAFTKLQAANPNDATVWYYSALANGFATGQWRGETERLVNVGLDKEKAGQPARTTVDTALNGLTPATGKDWLADYRKRIGPQ